MNKLRAVLGERGTTLVELVLSLAILAIIMLPISLMLNVGYRSSIEENNLVLTLDKARTTMTMIMNDLRESDFENSTYDEQGNLIKHAKNNVLTIKDDLVYEYSTGGFLMRNGEIVCDSVKSFTINERFDGVNSNVIDITLAIQVGDSKQTRQNIVLKDSYWRRAPVTRQETEAVS